MKKRILSLILAAVMVLLCVAMAVPTFAASYPLIFPEELEIKAVKGEIKAIKFNIWREYNNEKIYVNIYKGTDVSASNLVGYSVSNIGSAYSELFKYTLTVDTSDYDLGTYTVEYYMEYYSMQEWHEIPFRKTLSLKIVESCSTHTWGEWKVESEATCTAAGTESRKCTVCGKSESRSSAALGHSFGTSIVTKQATCTETGIKAGTCTRCGATSTESIPALGHSYGAWTTTKQPSCTEKGSKRRVCATCGDVDVEEIELVPHAYGDWDVTKEATCTEKGSRQRVCETCGYVEEEEIIVPHTYGEWKVTKEATCTETGSRERVCAECGHVETGEIAAKGHKFGEWTENKAKSTATEKVMDRTCSVCGEKETKIEKINPNQEKNPSTGDGIEFVFVGAFAAAGLIALPVLKRKKVK